MEFVYSMPARAGVEYKTHAVGEVISWGISAQGTEIRTACGRTLKGARVHKGMSAYRERIDCAACRRTPAYTERTA